MSSEVELGKYRFADAPAATAGELFDAEFNRQMKVDNAIRSQEDIVKAFDDRSDAIKKTLGIDLPNPLRLPVTPPEYDAMGNVSKPGGQWVDHVADYTRQLKDLSDKHPEHSQVINASEPPDLMVARQKQALERKSADMQEAAGMIEGRKIPYLGKVPVVRDAVLARVLAHRRDEDAVGDRDGAQRDGAEEAGHGGMEEREGAAEGSI